MQYQKIVVKKEDTEMIKIKKQISHLERKRKTLIDKLLELNDEKVRSETKRTKLIDTLSKNV